jgi:hypothetical protein
MSGTEMFGEGKDVMPVRRLRWIAIGAAIFTALATLAIGADAFASQDTSRCARPPAVRVHQVAAHNSSWRAGAFKAFGCGAWRRMHHGKHSLWRTGLRS